MKTKRLDGLNDLHMIILSWLSFHPVTRLRTSTGLRADLNEIEPLCAVQADHLETADVARGMPPPERDFRNLVNELTERLLDEELFTFVLHPEVEPTNNFTERLQRGPALDRQAGRTSQTAAGAHRRTVIVSVLESLRANLEAFTLSGVLEEVQRWLAEGLSRFGRQWQALRGCMPTAAPDTG